MVLSISLRQFKMRLLRFRRQRYMSRQLLTRSVVNYGKGN